MAAGGTSHERRQLEPGEWIVREGELGSTAFLIESGLIQFSVKDHATGKEIILDNAGPGEIFGEMALIDNRPRSASAKALEKTVVIVISKGVFEEKLRQTDPFIRGLLNIFVRTIRQRTVQLLSQGAGRADN